MGVQIASKKYVVDALNELMPELEKAFAREGQGRRVLTFLQNSIMTHADGETLEKVLVDVRRELLAMRGGGAGR